MQLLKHCSPDSIQKQIDFTIETIIELIFYCFSGIGLFIGSAAFIVRRRKMISE